VRERRNGRGVATVIEERSLRKRAHERGRGHGGDGGAGQTLDAGKGGRVSSRRWMDGRRQREFS